MIFWLGATAALLAGHGGSAAEPVPDHPNLLLLFADDWGRHASILQAVDGPGSIHDVIRTPVFDRLARDGVFFRNAHVSAPSCTPSRSALLTGQHFWRTGSASILEGAVWDASIPSFPPLLEAAGYHIGFAHKVWSPGKPSDAPFHERHRYCQAGGRINRFSHHVMQLVRAGHSIESARGEVLREVRDNFRVFLESCEPDKPFFFWFGPTNTHRSWVKGSGKQLWGIDPDCFIGKLPPFLPDVPEVREDLSDYFGEVAAWDAAIGVMLDELSHAGKDSNTLVIASGDHGAPGFPHGKCNLYGFGTSVCLSITGPGVKGGRVVDDLVSLTDLAPTVLEAAKAPVPTTMTGRSLWPSLTSDQSGLLDSSRSRVFTGRERHVRDAREGFTPYPQRAIRTHQHLLVINFHPERWPLGDPRHLDAEPDPTGDQLENNTRITLADDDAGPTKAWLVKKRHDTRWAGYFSRVYDKRPRVELYDLAVDPHEMNNVADDAGYAAICEQLEAELYAELRRTGDPRMTDDGHFYESPPMAGTPN